MCMEVLPTCMPVAHIVPHMSEEGISCPGTEVMNDYKLQHVAAGNKIHILLKTS